MFVGFGGVKGVFEVWRISAYLGSGWGMEMVVNGGA